MKNNKYKSIIKLTSLLLSLLMVVFCFPVSALGNDEETVSESTGETPENTQATTNTVDEEEFFGEEEEFIPWELELEEGDLSLSELKTAVLNPSETPEIISTALIEEKQHVNRLYEQEPDIFTIMFQNRDGGKTTYVFSHPVKTISPNGAYTDMTAAQIQAVVNSTASTNATAQASSSLSLTASGNKIQINLGSDFIKSRIGNLDAENPIMSYNIGEFVIFKAGVSTLPNGITTPTYNVTEEAREWATPGSELPKFTFTPETDDMQMDADDNASLGSSVGTITPIVEEEIVVMSTTTSEIAGEYSLCSTNTGRFLSCSTQGGLTTLTVVSSPRSKWYFIYLGNSNYYIRSMLYQNMFLSYYEDSLCLLPQADNDDDPQPTVWKIQSGSESNTFAFFIDFDYLASTLEMWPDFDGYPHTWRLGNSNDAELLTSISITNTMINPGQGNPTPIITKYPEITAYTSTDDCFEWVCTTNPGIRYDEELGFCGGNTYGVFNIYCKYKYNSDIVSNTVKIIVSDDYDITSGAMYLIRPTTENGISSTTPLLTMNSGSNTLSLATWANRWESLSQAFTFTSNGDNTYLISAVLSREQYYDPNFSIRTAGPTSDSKPYPSTNKSILSNTLSISSSNQIELTYQVNEFGQNVVDQSYKWYIYSKNNEFYIVNSTLNTNPYLSFSGSNITMANINDTNTWKITFFGIDTPCIRQVTIYFCCVASTLQVLCAIDQPGYTGSIDLGEKMRYLNSTYNMTTPAGGATEGAILNALDAIVGEGKYIKLPKSSLGLSNNDYSTLINYMSISFNNGSPIIANVEGSMVPYYNYSPSYGKHFLCVIGYDALTQKVIISDCTYVKEDYYNGWFYPRGIHIISISELADALAGGGIVYRANL